MVSDLGLNTALSIAIASQWEMIAANEKRIRNQQETQKRLDEQIKAKAKYAKIAVRGII